MTTISQITVWNTYEMKICLLSQPKNLKKKWKLGDLYSSRCNFYEYFCIPSWGASQHLLTGDHLTFWSIRKSRDWSKFGFSRGRLRMFPAANESRRVTNPRIHRLKKTAYAVSARYHITTVPQFAFLQLCLKLLSILAYHWLPPVASIFSNLHKP